MKNTVVLDLNRCIGCLACTVACKMENNLGSGFAYNKVLRVGPSPAREGAVFPDVEMYFLPLMCQHCENPSCAEACPEKAFYRTDDGRVLIDKDRCSGCGLCTEACPYGLCGFNKKDHVAAKCDLCRHLTERGELPACVAQCAGRVMAFGDPEEKGSPAFAMLDGAACVHTLPDKGTKPGFRFILRKTKWIEIESK
jgi:Fe-S-cluster-containing dehydrogenase component